MRRAGPLAVLLVALTAPGGAVGEPAPAAVGGTVLVPRGAAWEVALAPAPGTTRQLAAVALAGVDVVAGRRDRGVAIHGDDGAAAPPPAWPLGNHAAARAAPAPFALADGEACACATELTAIAPVGGDQRVAVLWATTRFALIGGEDLRVLDLHVRYGDGLVVWLNGVEIARRRIAQAARPAEVAGVPRGPEWETFHVPVVPGLLRPGDNLVAVEVRPSARRRAPHLDLELVARPAAALVRGPVLQAVTATSATLVVETDLPVEAAVEWGRDDGLGAMVTSRAGRARRHEITLTGLPASASVSYRVLAAGAATPIRRFRTPPGAGEVIRLGVYGDVRGGHRVHAELVARLRAEDPDAILATGDLVLRGSDEGDWQRFFAVTGEMLATIPFWSAPGNHDTGRAGDGRRRFGDVFLLPPVLAGAPPRPPWAGWYSFAVGDVHVVMLDSNAYDEPSQLAWLELDLAAARERGARVILAATHDGPYSRGTHGGNRTAVEHYVPVLVRHGVHLLFSGHDHLYQRGRMDGLDYIVSGGGGAPLYPIRCGVAGRRACKVPDGMRHAAREHHYVMLTIYPEQLEACPRRADGGALEPCTRYPLGGRGR
jgi:acid phosphatase type 7